MELIAILLLLALALVSPFFITRTVLEFTAKSFADPRTEAAARAVRRVAALCVAVTLTLGLSFSGWCYYQAENYHPQGFDLGDMFFMAGAFATIVPIVLVVIGVCIPVRVQFRDAEPAPGFSRF